MSFHPKIKILESSLWLSYNMWWHLSRRAHISRRSKLHTSHGFPHPSLEKWNTLVAWNETMKNSMESRGWPCMSLLVWDDTRILYISGTQYHVMRQLSISGIQNSLGLYPVAIHLLNCVSFICSVVDIEDEFHINNTPKVQHPFLYTCEMCW